MILAGLAGCAGRASAPLPVPLPATADTGVAVIDGPPWSGSSCPPATMGDSALAPNGDFGPAWPRAGRLERGVRVYEAVRGHLVVQEAGAGFSLRAPAGSGIGYYLAVPSRAKFFMDALGTEIREPRWTIFTGMAP
jgi:hypothetical protein